MDANRAIRIAYWWFDTLTKIEKNDPDAPIYSLNGYGDQEYIQEMTGEQWQRIGHMISNSKCLERLWCHSGALDDHKMSCLFRGLTRSSSLQRLLLESNGFSVAGIKSMVPFLQNTNNLTWLNLNGNNIQSEGFNMLFLALSDSPIELLSCDSCDIESIEIDSEHVPNHLRTLALGGNNINADGCREVAKVLRGGDSTLERLKLDDNEIDDDGVEILVDALQSNTTLKHLDLKANNGVTEQGKMMLLKLVNDTSSIKATLQSNHTLEYVCVEPNSERIQMFIDTAIDINSNEGSPEAAGRAKVIWTQLDSETREELAGLQGVNQSIYSEIDPLHLPEVLALVDDYHGQEELYCALISSIAGVISIVNRKECIRQQMVSRKQCLKQHRADLKAQIEAIEAEIAKIEAAEEQIVGIGTEASNN